MRVSIPIILVIALIAMGCSGGSGSAVTPAPDMQSHRDAGSSHMLWGLWQFIADPDAGTLDIIQLRSPEMHLNALPFLEPPPCGFL
jgi:hypothetical protein